jgi:hypothetical protein
LQSQPCSGLGGMPPPATPLPLGAGNNGHGDGNHSVPSITASQQCSEHPPAVRAAPPPPSDFQVFSTMRDDDASDSSTSTRSKAVVVQTADKAATAKRAPPPPPVWKQQPVPLTSHADMKAAIEARLKKKGAGAGAGRGGGAKAKANDGGKQALAAGGGMARKAGGGYASQHQLASDPTGHPFNLVRSQTGPPCREQDNTGNGYTPLSSRVESSHQLGRGFHSPVENGLPPHMRHGQGHQHPTSTPTEWKGPGHDLASQFGQSIRQRAREVEVAGSKATGNQQVASLPYQYAGHHPGFGSY